MAIIEGSLEGMVKFSAVSYSLEILKSINLWVYAFGA
jgi:hypothetical protein